MAQRPELWQCLIQPTLQFFETLWSLLSCFLYINFVSNNAVSLKMFLSNKQNDFWSFCGYNILWSPLWATAMLGNSNTPTFQRLTVSIMRVLRYLSMLRLEDFSLLLFSHRIYSFTGKRDGHNTKPFLHYSVKSGIQCLPLIPPM